ncbi:MAG: N-acetyl-gamma-glutamyl-phosphate reductase [Acidaminococcales bacterium]|jgi:N-acetyl-gamma-glutamyl-phosphate reductase|nr:N-acetyl-gamma-glutamyl-phosphate reductase [Acidaminococcales bacterium]
MKISIIGATGYTGAELLRILAGHPEVSVVHITSESSAGSLIADSYPHLAAIYNQKLENLKQLEEIAAASDLLFIGLPHGHAMDICRSLKDGSRVRVIDLGADYRLKPDVYEKWYKVKHTDAVTRPVYGLSELYRSKIKNGRVIANPGCYVTASILALAPLLRDKLIDAGSIIIDAKSGSTGAGRGVALNLHFSEVFGNFRPYGVAGHRHTPEIEQVYTEFAGEEVVVTFTPHLLPIDRGLLATCYAKLAPGAGGGDIAASFARMYGDEYFIRLLGRGKYPALKAVRGSNYADIGWEIDERTGRVIVMSALDNLVKGASGQAVQNMNIMFSLPENTGLAQAPLYP